MTLLQPTYLWALFGLVIPLVIHLLNKGDVKTVKVGSVKFLREFDTKQSRKIRLNEVLLLLLRMLLIGLVVLFMAEPRWKKEQEKSSVTYLIEPSLVDDEGFISFTDSFSQNDLRWFMDGFPSFDSEMTQPIVPNYWQLARKLTTISSDSIVVFTKGYSKGIKGPRPIISKNIHWVVVGDSHDVDAYIAAKKEGDSIHLYKVSGNSFITDLQKMTMVETDEKIKTITEDSLELIDSGTTVAVPLIKNDALKVTIAYDESYQREMRFFSAALHAIEKYDLLELNLNTVDANSEFDVGTPTDLLIWLQKENVPSVKWATIAMAKDTLANALVEKAEFDNRFLLTERLTIQNTMENNLTSKLATLLLSGDTLEKKMWELDQRVTPETALDTGVLNTEVVGQSIQTMDISPWIWMVIVLLLISERVMSKLKKQ